jgi:hypothetical protein
MALENDNSLVMPVGPLYGGNGGGGFGGFGGDWGSLIVLFLIAAMFGGFGNGFGGGFGGGNGDFPWLMSGQAGINANTNDGFRDQMLQTGITSIRDGIGNLSTQLCGCCGDMQMALANGFSGVEQGANARQIANMQTAFGLQNAMNQGFNALGTQLSDCCCENRLATCQTQNIIQNEGNQTRFTDANNTRDIIQSQTQGTQAILDKLCALELDGYKRENDNLRTQLNMATLRESQTAQNAFIQQGFSDEVDQLYNRLSNCPVPSTPVYGRTPIFTCNGNNGCGCGCGNGF